jgi:hypothetical protein
MVQSVDLDTRRVRGDTNKVNVALLLFAAEMGITTTFCRFCDDYRVSNHVENQRLPVLQKSQKLQEFGKWTAAWRRAAGMRFFG